MILLRMRATFGCLDKAGLELHQGLNLLEMPNESGKSTWCAFLRAMLYGLESRKGGALSERNRCAPWSGAPMAGEVDLLWRGRAVTLRRFAKGNSPFGGFQAVYTGTQEPVPGLTADNVGETLLGVTKDAFQRTCFIPQGGLQVDASGDLERRIAALASAGEEDVSFSDAEGRLRDWRNARQSNRATGSLPRLRARRTELQTQRQRLLDARDRAAQAQADLERLEAESRELEADLDRHARQAEAERMAQARQRYEKAAQRLATAEEALAQASAAEDASKARLPAPPGPARRRLLPLVPGLVLGAALAAVGLALGGGLALPLAAAGVILAGAGVWAARRLTRRREVARRAYAEALEHWEEAKARTQTAQAERIAAQAAWEATAAQGEPPAPPALSGLPRRGLAYDQTRLAQVRREVILRQDQRARAQGEEEALGGLSAIDGQLAALERDVEKEERELAALNLALEALTAANAQLQARFSPALNAKAGALLSQLTGGRYTALTFTRQFQTLAQGEAGLKSAQLLSQGTADQAYLALRLAICLLALPGDDPAPLVLDDALVCFDDARLRLALDVLRDLARDRQVLLFTCQSRERLVLG